MYWLRLFAVEVGTLEMCPCIQPTEVQFPLQSFPFLAELDQIPPPKYQNKEHTHTHRDKAVKSYPFGSHYSRITCQLAA